MSGIIKQRFDQGQIVRVMVVGGLAHPKLVEMAGMCGKLHGVWVDQEHSAVPHADLELVAMACRAAGIDVFARVPPTDYGTIMRPLETGCSGVMVAQIRTMDEVHAVVSWSKYPPAGIRGAYTSNFECEYGKVEIAEHVPAANRDRWLAIQIETAEGAELVDQIAETEGVDWLFVGPTDLAVTLGVPGEVLHPKCVAVLERVSQACRRVGKPWGVLCPTAEHAAKCRELGAQLFSIYSDLGCLRRGIAVVEETFAALMD